MEWWLEGELGQVLIYSGAPATFALFYWMAMRGRWSPFRVGLHVGHAPRSVRIHRGKMTWTKPYVPGEAERQRFMNSLFFTGILFAVLIFGLELGALVP